MTSPARLVGAALRDAPSTATLLARLEASETASRILTPLARTLAPGLDLHTAGRCELRDKVLWLTVESAAEAAKLRQAAPRLLAALTSSGVQVYEMKTRVQAGNTHYPGQGTAGDSSRRPDYPPVSALGATAVRQAADRLPASSLQRALGRLARTLDRRRRG
jgi:hypothetical protein